MQGFLNFYFSNKKPSIYLWFKYFCFIKTSPLLLIRSSCDTAIYSAQLQVRLVKQPLTTLRKDDFLILALWIAFDILNYLQCFLWPQMSPFQWYLYFFLSNFILLSNVTCGFMISFVKSIFCWSPYYYS